MTGGGPMVEPPSGPGAVLRHLAGGIGGTGFPGSPTWARDTGLARYWSHEYVERILEDPDESHVWLVTKEGGYIEFGDPELDGTYDVLAPSDEYRRLTKTATGWELRDLAGGVQVFEEMAGLPGVGLWVRTTNPNALGIDTVATYDPTTLRLIRVDFPDGRREEFVYGYPGGPAAGVPGGMLWNIVEKGVDGSTKATWVYLWTRVIGGQERSDGLMQVNRPDGTKLYFLYNDSRHPGYLTRMELDGTGAAPNRVLGGWAYDDLGRVTDTWKGDTVSGPSGEDLPGPNAIEHHHFDFDTPEPGFTRVTLHNVDPVPDPDVDTRTVVDYEVDTDPASGKPRVLSISGGDCPVCGFAANSVFEYGDAANPMRPTAVTDGEGHRTELTYDAEGQVVTRREAAGEPEDRVTSFTYASAPFESLVTSIAQPAVPGGTNRVTTFAYDPATGDLEERHATGYEEGIDPASECASGPDSFDCLTLYEHNSSGQPLAVDPPGYLTDDEVTFAYPSDPGTDPRHGFFPDARTDFVGTTEFFYDAHNRRTRVQDVNDADTDTCYDSLDRVTRSVQRAAGGGTICSGLQGGDLETLYQVNEFGDLGTTILPRGNRILYSYDSVGRLVAVERRGTDGTTVVERTEYTLDRRGNRVLEVRKRADGTVTSQTRFEYPAGCQLDKVTRGFGGPSPSTTDYGYDCDGNLTSVLDPGQSTATTYTYDALHRLRAVSQPWGGAGGGTALTQYGYDSQDHLTAVTDAEGNVTTYRYSDRDLLTRQEWLDGTTVEAVTTYRYNDHGELVSETDARDITVERTVDPVDRVTFLDYPGDALDTTYTYGAALPDLGHLLSIARGGETIAYDYDVFGRTTQDGDLTYTHDVNGNVATIAYPGGITATYLYDGADRQASLAVTTPDVTDPQLVTAATYLPGGPLEVLALGNGLTETHTYDDRYFPDRIELEGAGSLLDWDYAADPVGNVTAIDDLLPSAQDRSFAYQPQQYFLTCAAGPWLLAPSSCQPSPTGEPTVWTYDKIGNRLSEQHEPPPAGEEPEPGGPGIVDTYSYVPNASEPPGRTPVLDAVVLGTGGTRDYSFGPAGHLEELAASQNVVTVTHDEAGQIARFRRSPGAGSSYAIADLLYDGRGFLHRVTSIEIPIFSDGFEGGDTTCWDQVVGGPAGGNCPAPDAEGHDLEAVLYDSQGLLHALTHLPPPDRGLPSTETFFTFAGRPVAQLEVEAGAETWTLLATDHLGTPVAGTDLAGALAWQGMLQPFGATHGDLQTLLKYPGQWTDVAWQDAASGINPYYNVHRWYEGGTGRYLQADPMGLDARRRAVLFGMPPTHPYAYTEGNPLTRLDPLARAWVDYLPEWFPWALQIRCFYYWRDCARQACDCANRLRGTVDEEELAELYAAAGGGYGGPLWEKCFTRIASCKTVVEVCPAAGWPDKPVGWP